MGLRARVVRIAAVMGLWAAWPAGPGWSQDTDPARPAPAPANEPFPIAPSAPPPAAVPAAVPNAQPAARPRAALAAKPEDPPPGTPPPHPPGASVSGVVVVPAPRPVGPRPPEPPIPGVEVEGHDVSWKSRGLALPPPLPPPDPFDPRPIQLRHDRIVSADGRLKEVRRIPQWVDVLDRATIEEWRPQSFGEMLRRFPCVMFADGGSPFLEVPVIRGLGGDRVRIMTDGVWPETQALGVAGGTISLWDPESTERVEVYQGPGAYLRGAEAGGGVINVVPRRPRRHEELGGSANLASSYNAADRRWRERFTAEVGQGRVAALGGVTFADYGHRHGDDEVLDPSSFHSWAADLALDYFLDNESTIGFTGQFVQARDIQSPIGGGDDFTQPTYRRTFLALTLSSFDVGSVFHGTRASIAFDSFLQQDEQTTLSITQGLGTEDKVKRYDFHLQGNLYLAECHDTWAELTVAYAHLERTETLFCVDPGSFEDFRLSDAWRKAGFVEVTPSADPKECVDAIARFEANEWKVKALVEDEWHREDWDFHAGVRLDYYHIDDDRTGEASDDVTVGVAFGASHHLDDCRTLYLNASYGKREPSLFERFSTAVLDGVTVLGNPDLDPEPSLAGEVGIKHSFGNRATLQAAVFGHWIGDYVGRLDVPPDQVWANVGDVFLYGAEVAGAYRLGHCPCRGEGPEGFASAGIVLSDRDDVVQDVPFHGRAGLRYSTCFEKPCGLRRWFAEAAVRGAADSATDGTGGGAFVTAEVLAGFGWARSRGRTSNLTLGLTNLFDADYTEPYARLQAAGRSFIASFAFDF